MKDTYFAKEKKSAQKNAKCNNKMPIRAKTLNKCSYRSYLCCYSSVPNCPWLPRGELSNKATYWFHNVKYELYISCKDSNSKYAS